MAKKYSLLFTLMLLPLLALANPGGSTGVEFLPNLGQWDGNFLYKSATSTSDIFLQADGFTYVIGRADNKSKIEDAHHGKLNGPQILYFHAYKVKFENALQAVVTKGEELETYNNYYLGNDTKRWKTGIHPTLEVNYKGLYDGIDMHVGSDGSNMKYEFIVAPGANPYIIKLNFEGVERLSVKNGNLMIGTSLGDATEQKPYVYQMVKGQRQQVACNYKVKGRSVSYEFPDGYNTALPLVIDPTVVFATFTGSTADNFGYTATYDAAGNFYGGGLVNGLGFPTSTGAFQIVWNGGNGTSGPLYPCDMGIIKYSPNGQNRIYGTYIGGNENETPHSMYVDAVGNLVIAGRTHSTDFPTTPGVYDNTYNGGEDIVVVKLNAGGTALLASTYIGSPGDDGVNGSNNPFILTAIKYNYGDDARSEIIIDNAGDVFVAASTRGNGFPTTPSAVQSSLSGDQDAVIFKFDPSLTNLMYSTYLGGPSEDNGYVITLDPTQTSFYVAGGTQGGMPYTGGTYQPFYQGGSVDGYIAKFQNSGTYPLQRLTSIGTANYDQCYGIQTDAAGDVYAMGQSLGGQFPVNNAAFSNANSCQFVIKMDANLTNNIYSTVYGSGNPNITNISPVAFLVDTCENVYVSGWGGRLDASFPASIGSCTGMPTTPGAVQSTTDGSDFYFIVLAKNMTSQMYGTFRGQNNAIHGEHVDGGTSRFDKNGVIYQGICGGCGGTTFPTGPGPVWSANNGSTLCNLVALKISFDFIPVEADAEIAGDTFGCAPYTVQFINNSTNGANYTWIFDDGSPNTTVSAPSHTFTSPGTYNVMLIVENANACNQTIDTDIITITVDSNGIDANFTMTKVDTCGPFSASFANTSTLSGIPGSAAWTVYTWNFGDGSPTFTGQTPPLHTFPDTGTYTITLTMLDTAACNPFDSVTQVIQFRISKVIAATVGDTICINTKTVTLPNLSVNGVTYHWVFGDGSTSNEVTPTINIDSVGTFTAYVIAINQATCNKRDTSDEVSIRVYPEPTADFAMNPNPHVRNKPLAFINNSTNTIPQSTYAWDFGDGTKSDLKDPPPHMYVRKGTYEICLTVTNPVEGQSGVTCPAVVCKSIAVDIRPIIDIPTAFSPNGDGVNDMLYVRGAAITQLDLKIFNRWGELVFETTKLETDAEGNLRSEGWDGTLRGKEQDMDAFAFVLQATFIDGTTHEEQGNITLIR